MNINQIFKQAQTMQKKMKEMQEEFAKEEFEGKSGGGLVSILMSGDGRMHKISIDPSLLKENDKEMLEDLIVAAFNEAKLKAEVASKDSMSGAFGNMGGMFPGINSPF
jgi:DNA-binding YbaB/EbfC family protein